jgi:Rab-like protein 2
VQVTSKSFNFAAKHKLPFFFVNASDGTNVVKIFQMAIRTGIKYQAEPKEDFYQEVRDRGCDE